MRSSAWAPSCRTLPTRRRSGRTSNRAATASATLTRRGGIRSCTTTPTRKHRIRPTPRSAAGSATGCGSRAPGTWPSCRGSPTPWTTPRSGPWPAPIRRSPTTATRSARWTTTGWRWCSAMRWRASTTTRPRCGSAAPSWPASWVTRPASVLSPTTSSRRSWSSSATSSVSATRRSPRTPCPVNSPIALPGGSPTCSTSVVPTTWWTRRAPRRWRR